MAARKKRKTPRKAARKHASASVRKAATKPRTVSRKRAAKPAPRKKSASKSVARGKSNFSSGVRRRPEVLRIQSVSPTLTVADMERSMHFYSHVLGFPVTGRWEVDGTLHGAEVRSGRTKLVLNQDNWQKGRDRVKGLGFRMYWETEQDVDGIATAIKARGGVLDNEPRNTEWGTRSFSITDPDGFSITISRRL